MLYQKTKELDEKIARLEISPVLVHLFVTADLTEAPQRLVNQFKGYPFCRLRQKYPQLPSRLPSLWSRSYYVGSVGQVSEETVKCCCKVPELGANGGEY